MKFITSVIALIAASAVTSIPLNAGDDMTTPCTLEIQPYTHCLQTPNSNNYKEYCNSIYGSKCKTFYEKPLSIISKCVDSPSVQSFLESGRVKELRTIQMKVCKNLGYGDSKTSKVQTTSIVQTASKVQTTSKKVQTTSKVQTTTKVQTTSKAPKAPQASQITISAPKTTSTKNISVAKTSKANTTVSKTSVSKTSSVPKATGVSKAPESKSNSTNTSTTSNTVAANTNTGATTNANGVTTDTNVTTNTNGAAANGTNGVLANGAANNGTIIDTNVNNNSTLSNVVTGNPIGNNNNINTNKPQDQQSGASKISTSLLVTFGLLLLSLY